MLNLEKMEKELNDQLNKETRLSLTNFLVKEEWKENGIKSIIKIIGLYLILLIPIKLVKQTTA